MTRPRKEREQASAATYATFLEALDARAVELLAARVGELEKENRELRRAKERLSRGVYAQRARAELWKHRALRRSAS